MLKFQMGQTACDSITGFTGIVTGFTTYITGCSQYLLQPKVKEKDGEWVDSRWVDEDRIEPIAVPVISLPTPTQKEEPAGNGPDKPAPRR